jgi:glucose-6-phosphate isomerase
MLKYDFSHCSAPVVPSGNTEEELAALAPRVTDALDRIHTNPPGFIKMLDIFEDVEELCNAKSFLEQFDNFVVLGIGGSALGNTAIHRSLKPFHWETLSREERKGCCKVFVWDNVDPDFLHDQMQLAGFDVPGVNASKSCFNIISKSGSTAESMAMYLLVRDMLEKQGLDPKKHIIFTTDPEKGILREIARKEGFKSFSIPQDVGGRFSVLSSVGLLSALAAGIDIKTIRYEAKKTADRLLTTRVTGNAAAKIALHHLISYNKGIPISVMFAYSNALYHWADWYRQLWAESLGKRINRHGQEVFVGPTPIKALGVTDQHSQVQLYNEGKNDKIITFLCVESFRHTVSIPSLHEEIEGLRYLGNQTFNDLINLEQKGTEFALKKHDRPSMRVTFPKIDEAHIGEFIITYEIATALFAYVMEIDPFNQPGVELGKEATYALMGRKGFEYLAKDISV